MKNVLFIIILAFVLLIGCQAPEGPFTIYAIGDSTMADKKPEVYPENGWCQVLENYFDESVTVSNHARNGRSSKSFIDEGLWQAVLDSIKAGDYVFIQFGHNDQKAYDSTRYTTPFGTYSANLERFILETQAKGANPILFTSLVRRKFGDDGKLTDTHGDYPVATREMASKHQIPLIDLQKLTEDWVNLLGDEPSKEMYLWLPATETFPKERKDDTHLSVKGANMVAQLAISEIKDQKLKLANRIK